MEKLKFIVTLRSNGDYQFNLKADNGKVILTSQGYSSKANCNNGIESVRTNSQKDERFDRKEASNGKLYFNLMATNGQVVGTSEMYESAGAREAGIESVKKNAPKAAIDDQTNG